jgi:hypothetical protein
MAKTFFKNFPVIQYDNKISRNLMSRAAVSEPVLRQNSAFYPYEAKSGKRADILAFQYYDDPYMDWLVFLSNKVVDPYYEQYLSYDQLVKVVAKKYGSVQLARSKTKHFEVNWVDDDTEKTIAAYEALPTSHKKYWTAVDDEYGNVRAYKRKELDAVKRTNRIVAIQVDDPSVFTIDENVHQTSGGIISATGNVEYANTTHIILKHIEGTFANNVVISGTESNGSQTAEGVAIIVDEIPLAEGVYWTAISYFDWEENQNEQRKSMRLLNDTYADTAYTNLKMMMK